MSEDSLNLVLQKNNHDQAPKAAKYAVLTPGHAGFPKRAERSEGNDTTPVSYTQLKALQKVLCMLRFPCGLVLIQDNGLLLSLIHI